MKLVIQLNGKRGSAIPKTIGLTVCSNGGQIEKQNLWGLIVIKSKKQNN